VEALDVVLNSQLKQLGLDLRFRLPMLTPYVLANATLDRLCEFLGYKLAKN
jgi:hypothetical protein